MSTIALGHSMDAHALMMSRGWELWVASKRISPRRSTCKLLAPLTRVRITTPADVPIIVAGFRGKRLLKCRGHSRCPSPSSKLSSESAYYLHCRHT